MNIATTTMRLLLLLLLTTTEVLGTPSPNEYCYEMYEILEEAVEEGYIKEQEAKQVLDRCLTIN